MTDTKPNDFAAELKGWMGRIGYKSPQAANALSVSPPAIRNWLAGGVCLHETAFLSLMREIEAKHEA